MLNKKAALREVGPETLFRRAEQRRDGPFTGLGPGCCTSVNKRATFNLSQAMLPFKDLTLHKLSFISLNYCGLGKRKLKIVAWRHE